ncbi:MAG: DUF6084 family protein [Acidimicrobiales bacterium]
MTELGFRVLGTSSEPYAAVPTIVFRLEVTAAGDAAAAAAAAAAAGDGADGEAARPQRVESLALHTQVRIEPRQRAYDEGEGDRLLELFGTRDRWADTQQGLLWAQIDRMVPAFNGSVEVDLALPCTYDFEVGAAKYLAALEGGEIPVVLLFSGTVFVRNEEGRLEVGQVPWEHEARWRLPVATWREAMDQHFPGMTWLRLSREAYWSLARYKAERAIPTWDQVVEELTARAGAGGSA